MKLHEWLTWWLSVLVMAAALYLVAWQVGRVATALETLGGQCIHQAPPSGIMPWEET
ncbi:MAG: hypothetical protein GY766_21595 [Herbaspirillum sp.]|uniref:hypothetical protein n=1 Tax=Herbaspirillum sp. TaxID=1890675 RepID=UPI00258E01A4|nr:hypothetical protein [Herbaspirillum sp.]MCP3657451.1 hypothetical protein [Herbaspirillum sp.]